MTMHNLHHPPTEFQSNRASIRTTLTGLGIECPQLLAIQNCTEPAIHTLPKTTRRTYQPHPARKVLLGRHTSPSLVSPHQSTLLAARHGQSSTPETNASWSFRLLSAASGLSPDVLATHISATAEIALQLMSNSHPNTPYFGGNTKTCSSTQNERKDHLPSVPYLPTPEMVPPLADINMRELIISRQDIAAGVKPTDTFQSHDDAPLEPLLDFYCSPDTSFTGVEDNDCDTVLGGEANHHETCVGAKDIGSAAPSSSLGANTPESFPLFRLLDGLLKERTAACTEREPSEYEPSEPDCPSDLDYSPCIPGLDGRIRVQLIGQRPIRPKLDDPDVDLGTPVVNAHFGITLTELEEKAERYRLRNHLLLASTGEIEYQYDKRWLMSFVGQLSQQGELIQEYRCYVIGCKQRNKRRDHILIHLGGHLGQRPFKCTECSARFLRKNECKRHEISHSGQRPFKCEFCHTGFVRQDLMKRHIARKHLFGATSTKRKLDGDDKKPMKRIKTSRDLS